MTAGIRIGACLLLLSTPGAAAADLCVVDYETFQIRTELVATDHAGFIAEQSAHLQDWYVNATPLNVMGTEYGKYGLPREVSPIDLEFHAFEGSVPILREYGDLDVPEILYVLERPDGCIVQAYAKAE